MEKANGADQSSLQCTKPVHGTRDIVQHWERGARRKFHPDEGVAGAMDGEYRL